MSGIAVELEVGRWIKAQVEGVTSKEAFLDYIPEGTPLPALRYQCRSRMDVMEVSGDRIMTTLRFQVFVTFQGEYITEDFVTTAGQIDEALHKQSGSTPNATILSCVRLETFGYTEVIGADVYRHHGGVFEIQAQQA